MQENFGYSDSVPLRPRGHGRGSSFRYDRHLGACHREHRDYGLFDLFDCAVDYVSADTGAASAYSKCTYEGNSRY